jgi:hypothetical protein
MFAANALYQRPRAVSVAGLASELLSWGDGSPAAADGEHQHEEERMGGCRAKADEELQQANRVQGTLPGG